MHENKSFQRQKYKAGTGKHSIERTGQEKLFYSDWMVYIKYFDAHRENPDFVVVTGGASGEDTLRDS
jgi:hypothetical protein